MKRNCNNNNKGGYLIMMGLAMVMMAMTVMTARAKLPDFNINKCPPAPINWANTSNSFNVPFFLTDCSSPAIQQTEVFACYDNNNLYFHFECIDNNIYSIYTECNQDLYNQDVVEVFIAPTTPTGNPVHNYIELELSPNGVLFAANVTNPNLVCSGIVDSPLPCNLFQYSATRNDAQDYWVGDITIPWNTLSSFIGGTTSLPPSNTFQLNFFRVDTPLSQSKGEKEYSCWSCDNTDPPCFHMPAYFGTLILN